MCQLCALKRRYSTQLATSQLATTEQFTRKIRLNPAKTNSSTPKL
ncbi:hypothetical protein [Sphaerothrix gracilis]